MPEIRLSPPPFLNPPQGETVLRASPRKSLLDKVSDLLIGMSPESVINSPNPFEHFLMGVGGLAIPFKRFSTGTPSDPMHLLKTVSQALRLKEKIPISGV